MRLCLPGGTPYTAHSKCGIVTPGNIRQVYLDVQVEERDSKLVLLPCLGMSFGHLGNACRVVAAILQVRSATAVVSSDILPRPNILLLNTTEVGGCGHSNRCLGMARAQGECLLCLNSPPPSQQLGKGVPVPASTWFALSTPC